MGAKEVSARWLKTSKALKKEDQIYGQKIAEMAPSSFFSIKRTLICNRIPSVMNGI
jgi:hypothetical protein